MAVRGGGVVARAGAGDALARASTTLCNTNRRPDKWNQEGSLIDHRSVSGCLVGLDAARASASPHPMPFREPSATTANVGHRRLGGPLLVQPYTCCTPPWVMRQWSIRTVPGRHGQEPCLMTGTPAVHRPDCTPAVHCTSAIASVQLWTVSLDTVHNPTFWPLYPTATVNPYTCRTVSPPTSIRTVWYILVSTAPNRGYCRLFLTDWPVVHLLLSLRTLFHSVNNWSIRTVRCCTTA